MSTHTAVGIEDADELFASLARFSNIVVAVSGGPDSLALMILLAEWRARLGSAAPALSVATVDHGLRAASASEADYVSQYAASLGLSHRTLVWRGDKPAIGIPQAARTARYRLLAAHAATLSGTEPPDPALRGPGLTAIATAHTRDDQAETLVMRLARGAGVDGLAAMPAERPVDDRSAITLVRPLLGISKSRLVATLHERGVAFLEDPTNTDRAFERVRVRELLQALEASGVSAQALATSARRMGEALTALDYAAQQFETALALSLNDDIFCQFDRAAFERGPVALRQRVLKRLLDRFGGASKPARLSEIEDLANRLARVPQMRAALGGAVVSAGTKFVRIWREHGRIGAPHLTLAPGSGALWDRRFWVAVSANAPGAVDVRPLGAAGALAIMREKRALNTPARAIAALPAFWAAGTLLAVPSLNGLSYQLDCFETAVFSAVPVTPAGTGY